MNEKAPEFISLFIDENLKKGLKGVWRSLLVMVEEAYVVAENRNRG